MGKVQSKEAPVKGAITPTTRVEEGRGAFTREQINLIKNVLCRPKDRMATDDELGLFLAVCNRHKLDPFKRQIYAIFRWDSRLKQEKMILQTGIDGYRSLAARTREYAGSDDPTYDTETGEHPNRATVTVYRFVQGQKVAFTATARWAEYVQRHPTEKYVMGKWATTDNGGSPWNQLGKCAEALALRKGFPDELSGIYAEEELQHLDTRVRASGPSDAEIMPRAVGEDAPQAPAPADEVDPPTPDDVAQAPAETKAPAQPAPLGPTPESAKQPRQNGKAPHAAPKGELRIPPDWPDWKYRPISQKNKDGSGKGQVGRIHALASSAGVSEDGLMAIIGEYGYGSTTEILCGHYDEICERVSPGSTKRK